jgi:hypothetical protein
VMQMENLLRSMRDRINKAVSSNIGQGWQRGGRSIANALLKGGQRMYRYRPNWTGAPGSHQRTWDEKEGRRLHDRFSYRSTSPIMRSL